MSSPVVSLEAENRALRDEIAALEQRHDGLRGSRDRFKDLYEWAPDMCASIDIADATIVECNSRVLEELGYERADLLGRSVLAIVDPADHELIVGLLGRLVTEGELRDVELRLQRRDGSMLAVSLNVTTRRDAEGRILYARSVARDITAQKATEDALMLSEARLRTLTEALSVVPWQVTAQPVDDDARPDQASIHADGLEYHLDYVGPQFESTFGHPRPTRYTPQSWSEFIHPEDLPGVLERAAKWITTPGSYRDEYRLVRADGNETWLLNLIRVVFEPCGRRVLSGVAMDISEFRAAEAVQARLMDELNHRVKNSFATVTSILEQTLATSDDAARFLETFHGRVRSLATIHNTMARSDWTGVDLSELVPASLAPFGEPPRVCARGASIRVGVDVARALGMVLHELATNAVKYGALSVLPGAISVGWRIEEQDGRTILALDWTETGGPPVRKTSHRGYGLNLIETLIPYELGGETTTDWAESGLRCEIRIPLSDPDDAASPAWSTG